MYPRPKSISVHDAMVVTCFGNIFIRMETTEPQQNASAIPVKNLKNYGNGAHKYYETELNSGSQSDYVKNIKKQARLS